MSCTVNPGACCASTWMCRSAENPAVSPGSATRLSTSARRASVACSAAASCGTSTCGITLVNHDPGPSTTRSAAMIASTACRVAGGLPGSSRTRRTLPDRRRHRDLAPDHPAHPRIGLQAGDVGLDLQRDRAHRQHPALEVEDAAQLVERGDRIGEHLVEPGEQQVADRVARPARRCRRTGAA